MTIMEDLARAFYAPGRVGKAFKSPEKPLSPAALVTRISVLVLLPALGFGWVLLYALAGGTAFSLTLQAGAAIDLGFISLQPAVLVPVLAALVLGAFWFLPTVLFFGINAAVPANRQNTKGGFFGRFVAATSSSFGIHYAFLALTFWIMTSQATFFWGMRTIEDTIFSTALLASLVLQLTSMFVMSKNYFSHGLGGSIVALLVMAVAITALLYALVS
jgi:hypothetical protein